MEYKKIFFPLGGGGELRGRIHGALLVAKHFNSHLEILKSQAKPSKVMRFDDALSGEVLKELNAMAKDKLKEDLVIHDTIFQEEIKNLEVLGSSKAKKDIPTAEIIVGEGLRSEVIEQESKFCDLVIVSSPHEGRFTATFEATITKSGKPALMFPREMKKFKTNKILIGWNNTPAVARAVSEAIPIMQQAKKVQIISSKEYISNKKDISKLQAYLAAHDIETEYELVKTTKTPGEALLKFARDGKYDLMVAGAFGHRGIKELMFGGTTKYILKNSDIPIFMAH